MHRPRLIVGYLVALLGAARLCVPGTAHAGGTTPLDFKLFEKSVIQELKCTAAALATAAPRPCTRIDPPACAGDAVAAVQELLFGALSDGAAIDARSSRRQLRCQRSMVRAAARYVRGRPAQIALGGRAATASRLVESVAGGCAGVDVRAPAALTRVPSLGGSCASATPPAGSVLDAGRLGRCLRASLESIAQDVAPARIKPSFVVVMTDDQNLPSLQSMPNVLEQLASRGITFSNAFASTPLCSPSRASLLTARYPHRHGITGNFDAAVAFGATPTLASWLADAGYRTGLIGKYLNMAYRLGSTVPAGWDEWYALYEEGAAGQGLHGNGFYGYAINDNGTVIQHGDRPEEYSTDVLAERVLRFIRGNADRPFFLLFTPYAPHGPALPAPRHELTFYGIAPWRPPNFHEPDVSTKPAWVRFMKASAPAAEPGDELRRKQLGSLQAVDEAVARINQTLESLGIGDNTVVIFTSDHGFQWGEHWWVDKFAEYEESLRIPLLLRYPVGNPEPAQRSGMVLIQDLAPTIADLAGAATPPGVDGRSLVGMLAGDAPGREAFYIRCWGGIIAPPWLGVRTERWKYVHLEAGSGIDEELYDLQQDPWELANLALDPAHADTLAALRQRAGELGAP